MLDSFDFYAFCVPTDARMSSPDKHCDFINQLLEQGYSLVDGYAWPPGEPSNIIEPSKIATKVLNKYRDNAGIVAEYFWKASFDFRFSLDPADSEFWLLSAPFDTLVGINRDLGEHNVLEFLKILRKSLEAYPPYFGCGNPMDSDLSFVDPDISFKALDIYDINFYSATYLEQHLDRRHLLSAPAWWVEEIANGILLIPSLQGIFTDDEDSLNAVRAYLLS